MRKMLIVAIVALAPLALVGCGSQDSPTAPRFPNAECNDAENDCSISVTELGDDVPGWPGR